MKIAIVKQRSMESTYGPGFDEAFFERLWEKSLIDRLDPSDEVDWIDFMKLRDFDKTVSDYDAVIGAWIQDGMISEKLLSEHPRLKYVSTLAHGFGQIDEEACHKHHCTVTNTVYGDTTIAEYAWALLMDICHNISKNDYFYRVTQWEPGNEGKRQFTRQIELYNKTFGVVGLGNIGLCAAKMAKGFGMKVVANSRHKKTGPEYEGIEQVSLDEVLERSDVISIHCPLTPETKNLIDAKAISKMKDGVILINTARGAIIDEVALKEALDSGKIYAAGLDVVAGEPLTEPCELMKCQNTRITEHIAWMPIEAKIRSIMIAGENFLNWKEGHPTSVVA
jgi:glycerate dehydrogenase